MSTKWTYNKENDVFKDMNDWLTGRQSRQTRYLLNIWCCVVEGIRVGRSTRSTK